MKNLYLLRHAKSSWDDPSLSDGERPLNGRGRRDAPRMGEALGARLVPMTFYVSPAERAQQTFRAVQRNWKGLKKRHGVTTPALYTFDYREVLDWISQQPDELECLAYIGHPIQKIWIVASRLCKVLVHAAAYLVKPRRRK